jgi:hypothetical protein
MEFVNLTPHAVGICDADGNVVLTITPSGVTARAKQTEVSVGNAEFLGTNIPLIAVSFGDPEDLPEPTDSVGLIVSVLTVSAARSVGRITSDLYTVGQTVRNTEGQIIGAKAQVRN